MNDDGMIVGAHPDRVADADQHAAKIGATVQLSRYLPADRLLVIDHAELRRVADKILEDAKRLTVAPPRQGRFYRRGDRWRP